MKLFWTNVVVYCRKCAETCNCKSKKEVAEWTRGHNGAPQHVGQRAPDYEVTLRVR